MEELGELERYMAHLGESLGHADRHAGLAPSQWQTIEWREGSNFSLRSRPNGPKGTRSR